MKSFIDKIYEKTFPTEQPITERLLDFYEQNPSELDIIIEEESFQSGFLVFFFILGLFITVVARVLQFFLDEFINEFIKLVILDVISEIGIAVFGGTLVAYFIEFLRHKQFEKNQEFRKEIMRRLDDRKKHRSLK